MTNWAKFCISLVFLKMVLSSISYICICTLHVYIHIHIFNLFWGFIKCWLYVKAFWFCFSFMLLRFICVVEYSCSLFFYHCIIFHVNLLQFIFSFFCWKAFNSFIVFYYYEQMYCCIYLLILMFKGFTRIYAVSGNTEFQCVNVYLYRAMPNCFIKCLYLCLYLKLSLFIIVYLTNIYFLKLHFPHAQEPIMVFWFFWSSDSQ